MVRYTFQDALPLTGSSAALVTAAIGSPHPLPLPHLARVAGISRFAATRAADPAREMGVLVEDGGLWEFNDEHELSRLLCQLAWRFSGVVRSRKDGVSYRRVIDQEWGAEYRYRELVPESLLQAETNDPSRDVRGPDLVQVRALVDWGRDIMGDLRSFEADGQEVYSLWRTERLRDLIHQTLHFGEPLSRAISLMTPAAGAEAQGEKAPHEVNVTAFDWARATYLVAAEAHDLVRVIRILETAIRAGGRMHTLREDALGHLEMLARAESDSKHRQTWIDQAVQAAADAQAIWRGDTDTADIPYKHIGGMPRPVDVGTAGDKVYAVRLLRSARRLVDKTSEMASHPAFTAWSEAHPLEADQFPLISEVPSLASPRFSG